VADCARELSEYKVPESFTILSAPLPRNANGKLLKGDLSRIAASISVTQAPS
jgi:O-succinylbenzoic acid--CoA ligase